MRLEILDARDELAVFSRQSAVVSWQLAVGSWQRLVVSRQGLEILGTRS